MRTIDFTCTTIKEDIAKLGFSASSHTFICESQTLVTLR
jgi:hypothetical protein